MAIDKLDHEILWHLDNDARLPLAELARRVKTSRQVLDYRLKKLTDELKVITGFISSVDIHSLGILTYRLYLRFHRLQHEGRDKVLSHLMKHQHVLWLVETQGAWDVEVVFACRNFIHFNNLLKDFLADYEPFLSARNVSMSPVSYHFKRDYLVGATRKDFKAGYYGFEPQVNKLDKVDLAILHAMSKNCRLSYEELAKVAKVTPQTARTRLAHLEAEHSIPSHRILIDLKKLDRRYVKLLVKLKGLTKAIEKKLYQFCAQRNYVIYLTEVLGDWQMEIETEIEDDAQINKLIKELGNAFAKQVVDCEVLEVVRELKMDYFPTGS